jgi:hypothetical protein
VIDNKGESNIFWRINVPRASLPSAKVSRRLNLLEVAGVLNLGSMEEEGEVLLCPNGPEGFI